MSTSKIHKTLLELTRHSVPHSSTIYRNTALDATPATISPSPGAIYGWKLLNLNTDTVYIKLYDNATPTVGMTVPFTVLPIPPGDGTNPGMYIDNGFKEFSALAIAAVTGIADSDTTAPTSPIYAEIIWDD